MKARSQFKERSVANSVEIMLPLPPDAITQQPVNPAPGTKTGLPVAAPENQNVVACDPKVDLCPQPLPAEPLPPPSKPMKVADTGKTGKPKATDTKCATDKVVDGTKAGEKVVDGTKPADCAPKMPKKKLVKKKKPKAPDAAAPGAPAAADPNAAAPAAPAPGTTPPPPPAPSGQ